MPRTKGATDKTKRKSKLGRNLAIGASGAALVTSGGIYGKNLSNRAKVAKGVEKADLDTAIKKAASASKSGNTKVANELLANSTNKASAYAQRTNLNRALTIAKGDVKTIGKKVLGKIIKRGK